MFPGYGTEHTKPRSEAGNPRDSGQEPLVPDLPLVPRPPLPPMDMPTQGPNALLLPPLNAPPKDVQLPAVTPEAEPGATQPRAATGESQMTLISPTGMDKGDGTDWAVVLGIALVAEIGLLWGATCVGLWRRRVAFDRAMDAAAREGRTMDDPGME